MDWQINYVKPLVIGGVMVSVMQAVIVTIQLAVVAWMESMVAHKRVMQCDLESMHAETELMAQSESELTGQTEAFCVAGIDKVAGVYRETTVAQDVVKAKL